jgi:hypothetical protein
MTTYINVRYIKCKTNIFLLIKQYHKNMYCQENLHVFLLEENVTIFSKREL